LEETHCTGDLSDVSPAILRSRMRPTTTTTARTTTGSPPCPWSFC